MVYRLPPVLSRFPVSSRAIRPTFPPRPCRFPVSSSAIRPTFPPRQCRFPVSSRAIRPTLPLRPGRFPASSRAFRTMFPPRPCRFPVSSRAICPTFPPARAIFPPCCALFARRSRLSVRFPVASCVNCSASLPVRPVSRSVPFRTFCAPFFLSFAGYYCTRRTTLLFGGLLGNRHTRVRYNPFVLCCCMSMYFILVPN